MGTERVLPAFPSRDDGSRRPRGERVAGWAEHALLRLAGTAVFTTFSDLMQAGRPCVPAE